MLDSLATMPDWQKLVWLAVCLAAFRVAESTIPLRALRYSRWRHARLNLSLLLLTMLVGALSVTATVAAIAWGERHGVGLLRAVEWPAWVEALAAVALLDLVAQYAAHVALHRVAWLWPFHTVHHSDRTVDATTGTRVHPGDYVVRECFVLTAVLAGGVSAAAFVLYRLITVFFTFFTHADISLPDRVDRALSLVVVTPNMHKFHHHDERPWTDSNFGNVLSVWDRLFGTFVYDDVHAIRYGLDSVPGDRADGLASQLRLPFGRRHGLR